MENAEVQKWKYESQSTEVRRKVFSALLTCECMYVLRPCRQKVTLSLQCERWILGSRTAASVAITNCACQCDSQTQAKTSDDWAIHVGTMFLDSLDSDADVSVVIVLCQWLRN